jgi:hypothetical protein
LNSYGKSLFIVTNEFQLDLLHYFLTDLDRVLLYLITQGSQQPLDINKGNVVKANVVQCVDDIGARFNTGQQQAKDDRSVRKKSHVH